MAQWSRIFNVNKAADHLIPEENEKWLNCSGGGEKMDPRVVTTHDYQVWLRKRIIGLGIGSIIYVD